MTMTWRLAREETTACKCGANQDIKTTNLATRQSESLDGATSSKLEGATCGKLEWKWRRRRSFAKNKTQRIDKVTKTSMFFKSMIFNGGWPQSCHRL